MNIRKTWTAEEDKVLISHLKSKKFKTRQTAIKSTAKKLNRTFNSVNSRMYQLIKKDELSLKMTRYTDDIEDIIQECIKRHPENYQKAFREASLLTNKSVDAINSYWYKKLRKKSPVLTIISSEKKTYINTKNATNDNNRIPIISRIWNKILKLFYIN